MSVKPKPTWSLSGHKTILLCTNGSQSVLFIALQPLAQVVQIVLGNNFCAASQAFSPSTTKIVSPFVPGGNLNDPADTTIYAAITNQSGITTSISVDLTLLQLEA